jgi:hypothetical protein
LQVRVLPGVYGERSSVGRAPDCDSGGRGFEPHRSPILLSDFHVSFPFFSHA